MGFLGLTGFGGGATGLSQAVEVCVPVYCTLDPSKRSANNPPTLSNGNLTVATTGYGTGASWTNCGSTISVADDTGKYYFEVTYSTMAGTYQARFGIAASGYPFTQNTAATGLPWLGSNSISTSWSLSLDGQKVYSDVQYTYTNSLTTTDVYGVALDTDNHTLTFYKNGSSLGQAFSSVSSSELTPAISYHTASYNVATFNFGVSAFAYTPPANHKPFTVCES